MVRLTSGDLASLRVLTPLHSALSQLHSLYFGNFHPTCVCTIIAMAETFWAEFSSISSQE